MSANSSKEEIVNRLAQICGNIDVYSNVFVIACQKTPKEDGTRVIFFGNSDNAKDLEIYGISNLFSKLMDAYILANMEGSFDDEEEDDE